MWVWPAGHSWGRGLWAWPAPAGYYPSFPHALSGRQVHTSPGVLGVEKGMHLHLLTGPARWMLCREIYCSGHIWVLFPTDRKVTAWGVLGRELGYWGSCRVGQLPWALPLIGADTCDADRRYC